MIKYPEVILKYSSVYDERWKRLSGSEDYPNKEEVLEYIIAAQRSWDREKEKILPELPEIILLPWREDKVYCFVVGRCRPFAFPTTVPIYRNDMERFLDVLTHELIHRFFVPDKTKHRVERAWHYFNEKYNQETEVTRMHIIVYAIHSCLYHKLGRKKRLRQNIKRISFRPDYKRAWEIVTGEGYQRIIKELRENVI